MRTLVLSDDSTELNYIKALFNKLGIQVESVVQPNLMAQSLLGFNPELILVSTRSKKFDATEVALDLKTKRPQSKLAILKSPEFSVDDRLDKMDGFLDTPISPNALLKLLESFGQKNIDTLRKKLEKMTQAKVDSANNSKGKMVSGGQSGSFKKEIKGNATQQDKTYVKGSAASSAAKVSMPDENARSESYSKFVDNLDPIDEKQHYPEDKIKDFNKQLRKSSTLTEEEESIGDQKRSFVEVLFTDDDEF